MYWNYDGLANPLSSHRGRTLTLDVLKLTRPHFLHQPVGKNLNIRCIEISVPSSGALYTNRRTLTLDVLKYRRWILCQQGKQWRTLTLDVLKS